MGENNPYEKFVNQKVKIVQADGFIKSGLCTGYNEKFLFLEFDNFIHVAINFEEIREIKIIGGNHV